MRYRLLVTRRALLGTVVLEPNDVISLDTADQSAVIGRAIPWNVGAALGLLADGHCAPIETSADAVREGLLGPRAVRPLPETRVLPFRRPVDRRGA